VSILDAIRAKCRETQQVYAEIRHLHQYLADLQTIELAKNAYEAATAAENATIAVLEKRLGVLKEERFRLMVRGERKNIACSFLKEADRYTDVGSTRSQSRNVLDEKYQARGKDRELRIRVKKLVGRWHNLLGLDVAVVKRINCVADDLEKPIGEALVLLGWETFEKRLPGEESAEEHLQRLCEWSQALMDYHRELRADIDTVEVRYRAVLDVWRVWNEAYGTQTGGPETRVVDRWEAFVDARRSYLREWCEQMQQDLATIEEELVGLRSEVTRS
jgi:hypothetical protein